MASLRDSRRAWLLNADGKYTRADVADTAADDQPVDSQELLLDWYAAEARQDM
jgi:hypothetical protein